MSTSGPTMARRLRSLRSRENCSLREFARTVGDRTGYRVSHSTVREYERGSTVPAGYLRAVSNAFDVDPAWLLAAPAEPPDLDEVRKTWERFIEGLPPEGPLRDVILESWERCRSADVATEKEEREPLVPRVSDERLADLLRENRELLKVAEQHLAWLSILLSAVPHVVYLTSREGIVLFAPGEDRELLELQGLTPGHDWSEDAMGTNGAGTALATNSVVAVIGPEHYHPKLHDFICTGAPIRDGSGDVVAAVDVSTSLEHGSPERLGLVAYTASAIGKELELLRSSGGGS